MVQTKKPNKAAVTSTETSATRPRRVKAQEYQRWRLQKRIKHPGPRVKGGFRLLQGSLSTIWQNKKLFGGLLLAYVVLSLLLVRGFSSTSNLVAVKATLSNTHNSALGNGATLLGDLFSSNGSSNTSATAYQSILFIVLSLAIIWSLRQVYGKSTNEVRVKAAFYQGMNAFVPFVLVFLVVILQLLPLVLGLGVFSLVIRNSLAVGVLEGGIWTLALALCCTWSFYMVTSSVFALYIVTLPGVMPMQALRSAKDLVRHRRWTVMRKVLFMPITLFVITIIIMLPVVIIFTGLAEWVLFVLGLAMVMIGHTYLYSLYRELM